jgi:glycosyltransferase involved in cell wall biosynthesis
MTNSPLKVLIRTPLNMYSGYGRDGCGIARALVNWGCDVFIEPTYVSPPLTKDIAELLTKHLQAPFDLLIQHSDPDNIGITKPAAACSDVVVGWSMWEFSRPLPLSQRSSSFAKRLSPFDLFLMYDQVALDAWKPYGPKSQAWSVLQGGYESDEWKNFPGRDWFGDRFMFIMSGQLHNRKNPYCVISAFNELKHEYPDSFAGARLGLHTTIGDPLVIFGNLIPGMKVWHEMWEKSVLEEFYHAAHVLVAPSRGEGKNLPALEMMSTGGAVAATAWGGHMGWLNQEYAYGLGYELTPTDPQHPEWAHDAKVSVETMKQFMWYAYNNRAEVRDKAELAANIIPKMMDWSVVVESLFRRIRDLVPDKGEKLWLKAQACRNQ